MISEFTNTSQKHGEESAERSDLDFWRTKAWEEKCQIAGMSQKKEEKSSEKKRTRTQEKEAGRKEQAYTNPLSAHAQGCLSCRLS